MSRTQRIYNRPRWGGYYHPFRQVCMGHCKMCRDPMVSKRRRIKGAQETTLEIEMVGEE
jgi:hypothetical protein